MGPVWLVSRHDTPDLRVCEHWGVYDTVAAAGAAVDRYVAGQDQVTERWTDANWAEYPPTDPFERHTFSRKARGSIWEIESFLLGQPPAWGA